MSKDTKTIIKEHGFVFKKKFGQNFITNPQILKDIVKNAEITAEDIVIEIGPGAGTLTGEIAKVAKKVIAVEIDTTLEPILKESLAPYRNTEVVFCDILKWNLKDYLEQNYKGESVKVVANLPYYITTPILMKLLEDKLPLESITIMVQKEVADRIQAKAGSKEYGAITVAVSYYADASVVMNVPPHIFMPPPKVMSSVLHLKRKKEAMQQSHHEQTENVWGLSEKEEKMLFRIIAAAFEQRRKTLINALGNKGIAEKEVIKQALEKRNLPVDIRGEKLSLEEFIGLMKEMKKLV